MGRSGARVLRVWAVSAAAVVLAARPGSGQLRQRMQARRGAGEDERGTITVGGRTRSYLVHVPSSGGAGALPLVLDLHGGGSNGQGEERLSRFDAAADAHGFIAVYPDGVDASWADGRGGTSADKLGVDDVAFLSALIDEIVRTRRADPQRVYATGMSNGAFMAQRLACDLADKVRAVVSVASTIGQRTASRCAPKRPVRVTLVMGSDDPLVPFHGGQVNHGAEGEVLSAEGALAHWQRMGDCSGTTRESLPDLAPGDGTRVRRESSARCANGWDAQLYVVEGGGHTWPGGVQYAPVIVVGRVSRDLDANEMIWRFFEGAGR